MGAAVPLGRNYRAVWAAAAVSNLADGVFQVALPLLAIRLGASPAGVAGLVVASRLPWLLFTLHAGALADRLDRRATMVGVDLARTALIGGLAVLVAAGGERLAVLYAVAFLLGTGETLFDTSAQSLMPAVVAGDQLSRANGRLYAAEITANQFVGPPLGGVLAGVAFAAAFAGTAGGYLVAAVLLATLTGSFRPDRQGPPATLRRDIAEGLRYVWGHRLLRTFTVVGGVGNVATMAAFALFPVLAVEPGPLGLSEVGFGVLLTLAAAGSLLGSLVVARVERALGRRRLLRLCIVVDGAATALLATANLPVAAVVGVVLGVTQILWNVVAVSLRQRIAPDHLLGRVNAAHRVVTWGAMPLGAALGGALAEVVGVRGVFLVSGVAMALVVLATGPITDEAMAAAERAAGEPAS